MRSRRSAIRLYWARSPILAFILVGCGGHARTYSPDHDPLMRSVESYKDEIRAERAITSNPEAKRTRDQGDAQLARYDRLAEGLSLEEVVRQTLEHSPRIQAARLRWHAATQKRGQVTSLPDPMLNFKYFVRNVETRTGPQKWALGLSQRIPYPGKLVIAGKAADKAADAAFLRYEAAVRDQIAAAKENYFELFYIDRASQVTTAIAKLYQRYAALAAGGKDVGKTKLPEAFRAESQHAQLGYDLALLKEMRTAEAERLRATMGLTGGMSLGTTGDVADPLAALPPMEDLQAVAAEHNQELRAAGVEIERAAYEVKLARRAPIPDLTIGADYIKVGDPIHPLRTTRDGSKDAVGLNVGMSIPIWFPKYQAMAREAQAMEEAAQKDQQAMALKIRADLARSYFELSNASRLVRLYRDQLLPQARQAQQSAEELYRQGNANLAGVLETTATVHNFELARLRATADFYRNVARIEQVLGTALELKPIEEIAPAMPEIEKEAQE